MHPHVTEFSASARLPFGMVPSLVMGPSCARRMLSSIPASTHWVPGAAPPLLVTTKHLLSLPEVTRGAPCTQNHCLKLLP